MAEKGQKPPEKRRSSLPGHPMIKQHCPICGQAMPGGKAEWPKHPFCSPRCRQIDLGRWLGGHYRIPTEADGEDDPADQPLPGLP